MGVFDEVKERVTAREVMERAGIVFNRNNMCRCPFHQDKTASMKVKPTDKKYFCFGCGEKGDAIDFVAKYYNRSPREAAMQIADEFGIIYDSSVRSPPKPVRREKSPMQILEETKTKTYRVLSDYLHLLKRTDRDSACLVALPTLWTRFLSTEQAIDDLCRSWFIQTGLSAIFLKMKSFQESISSRCGRKLWRCTGQESSGLC